MHDDVVTPAGLAALVEGLLPGAHVERVVPLGKDAPGGGTTTKGLGYGVPLRISARGAHGEEHELVLHLVTADEFGHDRRADRIAEQVLAYDTFGKVPGNVPAVDVGWVGKGGRLHSLRESGEFYLLTRYVPGHPYAHDLRRIARDQSLGMRDLVQCRRLAVHLAEMHRLPLEVPDPAHTYARAVRDLVGHGEGIFGIIDGYPAGVPGASYQRLAAIEARCVEWRWRLRGGFHRLRRTHGDYHPFNVIFDARDELVLLDASRGGCGDPADDVTCMAINFVFFAIGSPGAWRGGMGELWRTYWREYVPRQTDDMDVLAVAAPFLAWRALVLANPRWYPAVTEAGRDAILGLAERALAAERFNPEMAEDVFARGGVA